METLFGTLEARFPDLITQYMPFSNMVSIRHDAGSPHETIVGFEGDVFETEDQRAFTDASYKTFSRPLEMPRPYKVEAGTVVRQVVTVQPSAPRRAGSRAAGRRRRGGRPPVVVSLGDATGTTVPAHRQLPAPGRPAWPSPASARPSASSGSRTCGRASTRQSDDAPAHRPRGRRGCRRLAQRSRSSSSGRRTTRPSMASCSASPGAGTPVARLMAVDPAGNTTSAALAERVRAAMQSAGLDAPLVGGSRAYLYQLVSRGVPGDLVDAVSFPTNPQVHAFDEASMAETIEALGAGVRTAAALAGGKPVVVGPVSLRPLFNPDLVGPEAPPPPGGLPWRYDARQVGDFAAAWTLGSVAAFASAGVAALTLHEAAGWGGLVAARHRDLPEMPAAPGTILPVGRVVAALAEPRRRGRCWRSTAHRPSTRWPFATSSGATRVLVANLGTEQPTGHASASGRCPARLLEVAMLSGDGAGGASWVVTEVAGDMVALPPTSVASLLVEAG